MESTASQSQHLDFFANKATELINFDAGASLYRFGSWGVVQIARAHQSKLLLVREPTTWQIGLVTVLVFAGVSLFFEPYSPYQNYLQSI